MPCGHRIKGMVLSCLLALFLAPQMRAEDPKSVKQLIKEARFAEAEAASRQMLVAVEREHGPDSIETAAVLDLLLESMIRGGATKGHEGNDIANRAVNIKEQAAGPDDPSVAVTLELRGLLLQAQGDYAEAARQFERSLSIREKAFGPDDPLVAESLGGLGRALADAGNNAAARAALVRAVGIRERTLGPEDPALARALGNLATVLRKMGNLTEAKSLRERSLRILEKAYGPEHPSVAQEMNNLSNILSDMGDFAHARVLLERALAAREKVLGPNHPDVAQTLNNLGILLKDMGDYAAAKPILERALSIRERALGPDHPKVAQSLSSLATLESRLGNNASAKGLLERVLQIREKTLSPQHQDLAPPLNTLGEILTSEGDFAGARSHLERALGIEEKALGADHPWVGNTEAALGALDVAVGDHTSAARHFERALHIFEAVEPGGTDFISVLDAMARLRWNQGMAEEAFAGALRAERLSREQFRSTARLLAEREALRYEEIRTSGLDVACSFLTSSAKRSSDAVTVAAVWDQIVASRGMVLDEMAARHHTISSEPSAEITSLAAALDAARVRLAQVKVRGADPERPGEYRAQVLEAMKDEEQAERALAERSESFRDARRRSTVSLQEIIGMIPPGSSLIAYVRYNRLAAPLTSASRVPGPGSASVASGDPAYVAMVLNSSHRSPTAIPLGSATLIDALVDEWRAAAGTPPRGNQGPDGAAETRYRDAGARLRAAIWDPIAQKVKGSRIAFIVPDGPLNLVSFSSLPVGRDSYLVEQTLLLHYLSVERDVAAGGEDRGRAGEGLLALGGPDYDGEPAPVTVALANRPAGSPMLGAASGPEMPEPYRGPNADCNGFRSMRFDPLPSSETEAVEIADLWARVRTTTSEGDGSILRLTGPNAGEAALKQAASGRRILHLATHAFFAGDSCAPAPRPDGKAGERMNPLLLSGLALTGANRRNSSTAPADREDGILTAEEIASLDLSGVDWAVLSGCETGVGALHVGEGVLGLRRAFEKAGARSLVMSLWAVEDAATRDWMKELYTKRLSGASTSEAVRGASLSSLQSRRQSGRSTHPFYWGAFVAAGDWR